MKKLFLLAILFISVSCLTAQSIAPRWGSGPPTNDNTGRVLTYIKLTKSFASTVYVLPNAFETIVSMGSLTGAQVDSASVTNAYFGDKLIYCFAADTLTAGRVVTFSGALKSAGTFTIAKSKKGTITFVFDGVAWIEEARAKQ